jgi:hypothetical protein
VRFQPEYWVLTKCEPEEIDNISLKLRDLHTILSLMIDQTSTYISAIEEEHRRCSTAIDLESPVSENARQLENLIRILFSAHLSAHSSVIHYVKQSVTPEGNAWLRKRQRSREALTALDRLRNMDVHNEPLNTLIGMRYRILGPGKLFSSLDTKETHAHLPLGHEGVGFYPPPLSKRKQFESQPGLVEFVTYNSILELAHTAIHEVVDLINEAVALGFMQAPSREMKCEMKHGGLGTTSLSPSSN